MNLEKIKNIIISTIDVEKIIIFGSHAWGNADENSDLDLFIVSGSKEDQMSLSFRVNKALFPRNYSLDLYIINKYELEDKVKKNKFIQKILNEGRQIYNKPGMGESSGMV